LLLVAVDDRAGLEEDRRHLRFPQHDELVVAVDAGVGVEELSDLLMGRWGDSEDDICLLVLDLLPRVVLTSR